MNILYNGKWDGIWDRPKYQEIRNKVLDSFKDLEFVEEGHKYYLHGKEITCVSNVTHMYKPAFDAEGVAERLYEHNYENPDSKYYHMTKDDILKDWKDGSAHACSHGTERHEFGESCFYFMTGRYDKILPNFKDRLIEEPDGRMGFRADFAKEEAITHVYEDFPVCYIPILAETKVYNEKLNYSGTFDILFYYDATLDIDEEHPNGRPDSRSGLVILDWKTNKDLFKNPNGQMLLAPFEAMKDQPMSLYMLQLSLYQLCLQNIGFKIIDRKILWLRDSGIYNKYPTVDYTEMLTEDLLKRAI